MIQSSHEQGILFFAAAGNEPVASPTYPAAYPEVIAVTAGTSKGVIAPYANYGDFVDLMAPGSSIVNFNGGSWLIMGTSASTAYASGAAAAMLDQSCGTPHAQIEAQIRSMFAFKRQ
jgi:thermitase